MSKPEIDARAYLLHAGRQCPACGLDGTYRQYAAIRAETIGSLPLLFVPCWCTRCPGSRWVESYRLEGVHGNFLEALEAATAETRTHKPEE